MCLDNICLLSEGNIEEFIEMDINGNDQGNVYAVQENEFEGQLKRNGRQLNRHY